MDREEARRDKIEVLNTVQGTQLASLLSRAR